MKYGTEHNYWERDGDLLDLSRGADSAVVIDLEAGRQLKFNPRRAAFILVDMQNYFGSERLGRGPGTRNLAPAIRQAVKSGRDLGMRVCWVNWGNRPDVANLPPSVIYTFKIHTGRGIGDELPDDLGLALVKDSWSADLIDELQEVRQKEDWWVDKYRLSGFPGTVLDATLRAHGIDTLFFGGVNTDQCVWGTLHDAGSLGYDCILLKDCTATTSPSFCYDAVVHNVLGSTGLVTTSSRLAETVHESHVGGIQA